MLKSSLITALLAFSGLVAQAQTPATPAAPGKAASTAAAPAKAASAPAAKTAAAEPEVKKSNNGICHDKTSKGYKSTKNFTEFKTLDDCLKSGGRAPKK